MFFSSNATTFEDTICVRMEDSIDELAVINYRSNISCIVCQYIETTFSMKVVEPTFDAYGCLQELTTLNKKYYIALLTS